MAMIKHISNSLYSKIISSIDVFGMRLSQMFYPLPSKMLSMAPRITFICQSLLKINIIRTILIFLITPVIFTIYNAKSKLVLIIMIAIRNIFSLYVLLLVAVFLDMDLHFEIKQQTSTIIFVIWLNMYL